MKYLYFFITFSILNLFSSESLDQWACNKISEFSVPDPVDGYFLDDGDYYSYLLGYKHAYQDILQKIREMDIEELEMAD